MAEVSASSSTPCVVKRRDHRLDSTTDQPPNPPPPTSAIPRPVHQSVLPVANDARYSFASSDVRMTRSFAPTPMVRPTIMMLIPAATAPSAVYDRQLLSLSMLKPRCVVVAVGVASDSIPMLAGTVGVACSAGSIDRK